MFYVINLYGTVVDKSFRCRKQIGLGKDGLDLNVELVEPSGKAEHSNRIMLCNYKISSKRQPFNGIHVSASLCLFQYRK